MSEALDTYLTTDIHNVVTPPHRCPVDGRPMEVIATITENGRKREAVIVLECMSCHKKIQIVDPSYYE